ncbi:phage portal protein [Croceicoccus sp. BE223]|uniref:phage portal protein n=1 Tax=Croceicoccus sp. BE223 TaxID=2817716 RepID=UPI00285A84FA|nr:phage portal protein [Croceicoccus sp. BE223]MDR7102984.1 HK97 family phage portal protein [Croceicoccus sp. BE223]
MGWLDRLFGAPAPQPPLPVKGSGIARLAQSGGEVQAYSTINLRDEHLPDFLRGGMTSKAGRTVSEYSAMRNATFNRAVNVVVGTIGMLPLNLFRRGADGLREKATDHPVHRLLRVQPNPAQTPYQFKSFMQGRALLYGNAFAYIVPGVRGPQALWPLDPLRVTIEQADDFSLQYRYRPKTGGERIYKPSEIFDLRGPWSEDGLRGHGLLRMAAEALGLAEITDEAAARLLRNGAYVGGILEHPKQLSEAAIERLKHQFQDGYAGVENTGRWIVAEEGLTAKPLGASGRDAEGLAQRKHQAEEVSRFTGVPRPLLMFDETSWGTGIEQLGLSLITYCLMPWFVAWEEVVARSLLKESERETLYVKFNEGALLRGSLKDQAEFLSKAIGGPGQGGWMVADEARELMDMNPMEGGVGQRPAWSNEETKDAS